MISKITDSLASFAVITGLLAGCSSSTTTTGTGTPAADGGVVARDSGTPVNAGDSGPVGTTCGVDTGSDTCGVCLGQKCCAQMTACSKEPDCVALDDCLTKCPDTDAGQQCADACYTAHPKGATVTDTIDKCAVDSCKTPCAIK